MVVIFRFKNFSYPASSRHNYKTNSVSFWGAFVKLQQATIVIVIDDQQVATILAYLFIYS